MSKIKAAFKNGKALIPFITAGDPDLETTEKLIVEMSKNGADIIEIGIPFSDPIAEGFVIQEADLRSLAAGTTTDKIFDMVKRVRGKVDCALVFMTYMNPIFVYGTDRFMEKCAECGISAVIIPDVPIEEKQELAPYCNKHGVELISFVVPATEERMTKIAKESQGFLYYFSSTDASGKPVDAAEMIAVIKSVSDTPCAVSAEISTPEQAAKISRFADGVIIGEEVVKIAAKHGKDCVKPVSEYIKSMKEAIL